MNRREFLKFLGIGAAGLLTQGCPHEVGLSSAILPESRPNIVLIMADDMGFSDIHCYGGEIDTPNLDRLAATGLRFTQFYNAARCCPTRASIMTGLYEKQTGIGSGAWDAGLEAYQGKLNNSCVTIAEVLRQAGYGTYCTGKWHLTREMGHWFPEKKHRSDKAKDSWPLQRGFNHFYGILHGSSDYYNPNTLAEDNTPIKAEGEDFYLTDKISDKTVQYIDQHVK